MNKKNLILGGILIILVGLAFLYNGPFKDWQNKLGQAKNFLAKIDTEQISKISIEQKGKDIVLEKVGDKWKIAKTKDFYVEDSIMAELMSALNTAKSSTVELSSENADRKADFGTDENGALVSLYDGENLLYKFRVGDVANDFDSTFVSENDSNKTYLVKANLNSAFIRQDWYDKTIFKSKKEDINKVRFQYPNREFTVVKKDDVWSGTLPYSFSVNKEKIDKILTVMSDLKAVEVPEQNFEGTGLEKNSMIIEASGEAVDNILMVGGLDEATNNYFVKRGNSDNIYMISKSQYDELNLKIKDLK